MGDLSIWQRLAAVQFRRGSSISIFLCMQYSWRCTSSPYPVYCRKQFDSDHLNLIVWLVLFSPDSPNLGPKCPCNRKYRKAAEKVASAPLLVSSQCALLAQAGTFQIPQYFQHFTVLHILCLLDDHTPRSPARAFNLKLLFGKQFSGDGCQAARAVLGQSHDLKSAAFYRIRCCKAVLPGGMAVLSSLLSVLSRGGAAPSWRGH